MYAFLCLFEKQRLSECPPPPPDILPKVLVNSMNTKHPNIKVTLEFEKNDPFFFLDVKITCSNNQLVAFASVFRKATFSGVFTNFKSFLPIAYKFGLVYTLPHRSFSICPSYEKFHEEIVLLKDIFKKNEHPQLFIDNYIKKYIKKLFVPKRIIHTVSIKHVLLVLPFLAPLPFAIRSRLQKCFKNYITYCSLHVVYQSESRVPNLFNFKNVVNTKLSSQIFINLCVIATTQLIMVKLKKNFVRTSEHLGITPLTGKFVKMPKKSAIFDDMLLDAHKAGFDNFVILLKERNLSKL